MSHGDKELRIINMVRQHFCTADKYGFSIEDIQKMESILDSAVPNNESNKFPDFVFKGGFIEHFQVTSSKETRKGAEHLKLKSGYNTKVTDIKSKIVSGEITDRASLDFKYPSHSYSDFKKSFLKKPWRCFLLVVMARNVPRFMAVQLIGNKHQSSLRWLPIWFECVRLSTRE